ncbi:hypothetical protein ACW5WQ_08310 [Aeromonas rivuli]|uniref:hypothetical protein n=1 Tax=Aeromonas rivuli TaxID=648794 RepID=UPI0005AAAC93|nr:hypothetical protein [Aeromonas rivuli]
MQVLNTTPSGYVPLPFDATLLFKALQYQLLVAVEYCYDLKPDECLWLEVFGDVTVPGKTQTEVKLYSDSLTDSHANFWNTMKNWLHETFDRTAFKSLVLLTSQEFGAQSQLKGWNKCTATERLKIMEKIFSTSQASTLKKAGKKASKESSFADKTSKPSKSQLLQQYVMAPERRDALMEVLERMHITTGADSLEQRIQNYQTRHLKPIRPSKYQQFIDELLGFMCSTQLVSEGWQITQKSFTDKLSELTHRYMKHPKTFPSVDTEGLKRAIDIEGIRPMPFAQKIVEIGGERHLMRAALQRVVAQTTISDLYADGVIFKPVVDLYLRNHLSQHLYGRESAMLDCSGVVCQTELNTRSMKFFLERNALPVEPFCGMEHTMTEFRNGIYHMLAGEKPEDEDEEFHWRLW